MVAEPAPPVACPIVGADVTVAREDDHASVTAPRGDAALSPTATHDVATGQLTAENVPPPELSGITSIESDQFQFPPALTAVAIIGTPL
jgi:hypothetical protein